MDPTNGANGASRGESVTHDCPSNLLEQGWRVRCAGSPRGHLGDRSHGGWPRLASGPASPASRVRLEKAPAGPLVVELGGEGCSLELRSVGLGVEAVEHPA